MFYINFTNYQISFLTDIRRENPRQKNKDIMCHDSTSAFTSMFISYGNNSYSVLSNIHIHTRRFVFHT